jgi:ribokinase
VGRASICVLGSVNMDLVAMVERVPELGETVAGTSFLQVPGGKGANQAIAAARAGADVRMLGAVGADAFGAEARQVLDQAGVDTTGLAELGIPTGTAHIVVDAEGRNTIVVVPGANGAVETLSAAQRDTIVVTDLLLLQLELPLATVVEAATWARRHGKQVVLTPAPVVELPGELVAAVDLLVPNEHEVALLTGERDPVTAARALVTAGAHAVVVTLGEQGCLYVSDETGVVHVEAPRVEAVDSTGAGDTFVGCLAVALGEGRPLRPALQWATAAAALSVQRSGASRSMPMRTEIDAALAGVKAVS